MFSTETYTARRRALQGRLDSGLVLLLGNSESPMNYADNTFPFRQDSTFLYYFGLDQPGLSAVLDLDDGTTVVFGDELTIDHIVWMGHLPTIAERAAQVGVGTTKPLASLAETLTTAVRLERRIHFLPPYRPENILQLQELLGMSPLRITEGASVELIQAVVDMRSTKSDEEIVQIEQAVDISVDMHVAAMAMARPGQRE